MTCQPLPPIEFLAECFDICSDSPSWLKWKSRPRNHFSTRKGWAITNKRDSGKDAGNFSRSGDGNPRYMVKICQKKYPAHRVVFALANGKDPFPLEVDHIDRNSINNNPSNLRVANRSENARNKFTQSNNTSGLRGVTWCKRTGKWMAQIGHHKKCVFLGRFNDIKDAKKARLEAEKELHQEFSPTHVILT